MISMCQLYHNRNRKPKRGFICENGEQHLAV
uniref:Uncharacterized protein n=1 Tax=Anguilla anguilla TaxID=7936 RepID=A0A0E9TD58_ANGAN